MITHKLIRIAGAVYKENPKWWHFWNPFSGWTGGAILILLPVVISSLLNCTTVAVIVLIYAMVSPVFACITICANRALNNLSTTNTNNN